MEASAAGAADPFFPIYISSDEEDGPPASRTRRRSIRSLDSSRPAGASSIPKAGTSAIPKEAPLDRKGKRKVQLKDDPSDSKTKRPKRKRFNCAICFERVRAAEKFAVSHCAHTFCSTCVGRYVAGKLSENVAVIGCPDPACETGFVGMDLCRNIIPPELFDRWNVLLCELLLGDEKLYCPFKDCSALLINDGSAKIRETECPHCHRLFCARCHVPWHAGVKCKEFRKLGDDEKGENDLMLKKLAKKEKWQRCPKCRMYVSRESGCLLINCRCKQDFCYHCAAPMNRETHYCENCKH